MLRRAALALGAARQRRDLPERRSRGGVGGEAQAAADRLAAASTAPADEAPALRGGRPEWRRLAVRHRDRARLRARRVQLRQRDTPLAMDGEGEDRLGYEVRRDRHVRGARDRALVLGAAAAGPAGQAVARIRLRRELE